MAKLVLMAMAATAAAAPLGAQTVPDPDGYGPPAARMGPPPQAMHVPGPGVSWREHAPPPVVSVPAPGVRTRTWVGPGAPPPSMPGMHPYDGQPPQGGMYGHNGPPPQGGMWGHNGPPPGHGMGHREVRRHVEVRRFGPGYGYGAPMGWQGGYSEGPPMGWQGGYGEGPPPPPRPCPCGPGPVPYGYGGTVVVTETTVTERPVVERRVWYTTVREKVRVAPRRVHRVYRTKLIRARPQPGERG